MMQTAHLGQRNNLPFLRSLNRTGFRSIFLQTQVAPAPVIIRKIRIKHASQVRLIEYDDVIQAFPPNRADQSLHIGRLLRRTWSDPKFPQSQNLGAALEFQAIDAVAVTEQIFWGRGKRKGFPELLRRPSGGGAVDHIEV